MLPASPSATSSACRACATPAWRCAAAATAPPRCGRKIRDDPRGAERGQPANPYVLRAALTAQAALSGWHGGRRPQGWWRHPDGSYGWVGPVFWPFAHDDLTNAIIFGDATSLSLYGYGDIYAAIFAPYAATELAAYTAPHGRRARRIPSAENVCDASDTGGLPVERIAAAVQPNEMQRTALDELAPPGSLRATPSAPRARRRSRRRRRSASA